MKATKSFILALVSFFIAFPFPAIAKFLPTQVHAVSTIPPNGDLNPYGVAFVPPEFPSGGIIKPGDILVSNFNNSQNLQGTGTTIVDIPANEQLSVFFQGNGLLGLTTALHALKNGLVLVGNFPSANGTCASAKNGSILVINSMGKQIQEITDPLITGPWDSAVFDQGDKAKLFISNALTGTVVRFDLTINQSGVTVNKKVQIASGYKHQCDDVTFVDGPTGLVYDSDRDILYVASTADNSVFAIQQAGSTKTDSGKGALVFDDNQYLHGPLGMTMAFNGHLVVSNNDAINPDPNHASALTEFTRHGSFVREITVDANPGGAFGLNTTTTGDMTRFAAVDDDQNLLLIWTF